MSNKLNKPHTDMQRADFISNNVGLNFLETKTALYALKAWEILINDQVIDNSEEYEKQKQKEKAERISMLSLTSADVERALYKALGKDFDDIIELASTVSSVDIKALKIELKANNFYRGNPYVTQIGLLLGITETQLDEFFETNDYTKLLPIEEQPEATGPVNEEEIIE